MSDIDPKNWFLPESDIPRKPNFTSGNEVVAFIDGKNYMDHLSQRLHAMNSDADMTSSDYLHIAGWRVSPQIKLKEGPVPTLRDLIDQLKGKGVIVRSMLYYFPHTHFLQHFNHPAFNHAKENLEFINLVNKVVPPHYRGYGILDNRLPSLKIASHHQKHIILRSKGDHWAYVGGIDLTVDRWDTPLHNSDPNRYREFIDAWHDVQCSIRGPAVRQIWENFTQRWNDPTPPNGGAISKLGGNPSTTNSYFYTTPPKIKDDPPNIDSSYETNHHVQVLRTLACGNVYSFLPRGEQTVRKALELAISKAEYYIYIEEQYLWPCSLIESLKMAVKRNSNLKVIMVLARDYDLPPPLNAIHNDMRNRCIKDITGNSRGQVFTYHLEQLSTKNQIYVHAKLMIIDDRYVSLGSANINLRSMTTDSELHLGIVDGETVPGTMNNISVVVCKFAKDLRINLWKEHLGINDESKLNDPITALKLWPDWITSKPQSPNQVHHAVCYHPREEPIYVKQWLIFLRAIKDQEGIPPEILNLLPDVLQIAQTMSSSPLDAIKDLALGAVYILLRKQIQTKFMNVETKC